MNPLGYNPTFKVINFSLLSGIVQVYIPWSAAVNGVNVRKRISPGLLFRLLTLQRPLLPDGSVFPSSPVIIPTPDRLELETQITALRSSAPLIMRPLFAMGRFSSPEFGCW